MEYKFEKLNKANFDNYFDYLKLANTLEPELMCLTELNKKELLERLDDELTKRNNSLMAIYKNSVVGRIEYHFYTCFQDGYRICYVVWLYVLPEYRNKHIAKMMFEEMYKDCVKNNIDEIRLIRATNENANNFYNSFNNAKICEFPFFIQHVK